MIVELERVTESERRASTHHLVMRREYWMRRIDLVVEAATADASLRRDAAALRERLAHAFAEASRQGTGSKGAPPRHTSARR
jgi:hypothetical protein